MSIKGKIINIFCLTIFLTLLAFSWASAQNLVVSENTCSGVGDIKSFTVSVDNAPNAVGALGFLVTYDKTVLQYQNFTKGALTTPFLMFDATEKPEGLKFGGFTMSPVSAGTSGDVAVINFTVLKCQDSDLIVTGLLDDFNGWSTGNGKLTKEAAPDLQAPVISCPANINVSTTANQMAVNFTATVTDDVDPNPEITFDPMPGSMFPIGITTVVVIATDASGKSSQCTFNVTVQKEIVDMTPPVITCPEDIVVETLNNEIAVNFKATATDDVDPNPDITYDIAPGSLFSVGTTTVVTATATDASGKTSECSFSVTVNEAPPVDMSPPTISEVTCIVSLPVAGEGVAAGVISYEIFANDDLDPNPVIDVNPMAGSAVPIGKVIPVKVKVTDASGKSSKVNFELVVNPPACPTVSTQPMGGTTGPFGGSTSPFGGTTSPFGGTTSPFGGTTSPFGGTTSPFGGTTSPFGGTTSPFGGTSSLFGTTSPFGGTSSPFGTSTFPF